MTEKGSAFGHGLATREIPGRSDSAGRVPSAVANLAISII